MQCVCGFACGFAAAAAQPQSLERPHSKFSKKRNKEKERVRPLAAITSKKLTDAAMQSLLRSALKRTAWAGRGPHPAPRLALSFQKLPQFLGGGKTLSILNQIQC
jgi:hypothetical protein